MNRLARYQRKKRDKSALYAAQRLKNKSLCSGKCYTSFHQTKKNSRAVAQHAPRLDLLRKSWHQRKRIPGIKRRDRIHISSEDVMLCRGKAERNPSASQHLQHHSLRAGLQGLADYRRNKNMAVQHHPLRLMIQYWKLWMDRVEEEGNGSSLPPTEVAFSNKRRHRTWVFYSWWAQAEKRKGASLSEREGCHLLRTWKRWRQRTREKVEGAAREEALQHLHRRNGELQACLLRDMDCMPVPVENWKKFVQIQRARTSGLNDIQHRPKVMLLKQFFRAWKKHQLQISQIPELSKERFRLQTHPFLRVFIVWWEKASLLAETRAAEQRAEKHFKNVLQLKVFVAWREAATRAESKRHQQGEPLSQAQCNINQKLLLGLFKQWRKQTRDACIERTSMEKAKCHHNSRILSKAMGAWKTHQSQRRTKLVMKRQGALFLRLKMFQTHFELWKLQLQRRRTEAEQTERALWHWSLTLQAKVLMEWRLFAGEQRRRREESVRSAQIYRDQLLREGVACILTYAAHMSDLTTSMAQVAQSHNLHKVVRRCAMRWKRRALSTPQKEQNIPAWRRSFCRTAPELTSIPSCVRREREAQDGASTERERHTSREARHQDVLLPPSAFMIPKSTLGNLSSSDTGEVSATPLHHFTSAMTCHTSTHPGNTQMEEPVNKSKDASALMTELLHIQLDMKNFQQSRKRLRAWRKLREVLRSWLQWSGEEDEREKEAVFEELKELDGRISRLSTELERRRPAMLLHAERVQQVQVVLCASAETDIDGHRVT
ncbi:uncharacterized protein sfi1 isoform X2 [Oryzias latipes]